jgi:flagellar motor switch protein FliN/FliY
MSQMLETANTTEALSFLGEQAAAGWQAALEGAFASEGFMQDAAAGAETAEDVVWFACELAPAQLGALFFGLDASVARAAGYRLLSAKGRPSPHEHHALHAAAHLIGQCAASIAKGLSARLNAEITAGDCRLGSERPPSSELFNVPFPPAYGGGHSLFVCASSALLLALADESAPAANTALTVASQTSSRNLDLLLDLEMPVSVSFGSTRLALKDVAKLTNGSIVELNRSLSEPVDIVVNNCPIARGEVVVVDGSFAVRIKQVISKQERLRSLS